MGKIPADYLPPKELWPEYIVPDEFRSLVAGPVNIAEEFLDSHVRAGRGNDPAILFGDQKTTFEQLMKKANKVANVLKKLGIEAQDRVGMRLTNTPDAVAINFGIQKVGAIPVPVSPLWAKEEIEFTLNNAEFAAFFVGAPLMSAVEAAKHDFQFPTKIIVVGGKADEVKAKGDYDYASKMAAAADTFENVKLNPDDIGVILYTSGTTGQPKGCVHFVKEVIIEAHLVNQYVWKLKPGEVLGGSAPVSFSAGYVTFCLVPFAAGATISLLPKFTSDDLMGIIQKHHVNVVTALATTYRKLLEMPNFGDYDISSVRMYTSGGDALTGKTLALWQAKTGKPIWEGLGCTEMVHLVTSNTMSEVPMPDSVGKALPGFEIKVIKEDGTEAGPGEVGSMLVKGPTGTVYWKPYVQDQKLLKSQRKGIKDGYNMMGDAVLMDKYGFIFFQAREDDMIKSSGFRLAPSEIEDAISRNSKVRSAKIVDVPDEILGQKVVAMVELQPGHDPSQELAQDIIKSAMDVLPTYKLPREIIFSEAIPRQPTGKLLKKELRGRYTSIGRTRIGVIGSGSITQMAGGPGAPGGAGVALPGVDLPAYDVPVFAAESLLKTKHPQQFNVDTSTLEGRPPSRYFSSSIKDEHGQVAMEASVKPRQLQVGKKYQCVFGVKGERPIYGEAEQIPPDWLEKIRNRQVRVIILANDLIEIFGNRDIPLEIGPDYLSSDKGVEFIAKWPGKPTLSLSLTVDNNTVQSITYNFDAVFRLNDYPDQRPIEEKKVFNIDIGNVTKREIGIHLLGGSGYVQMTISGIGSGLRDHHIPLKDATRSKMELGKRKFIHEYSNLANSKEVSLSQSQKEKFQKGLQTLGKSIIHDLFFWGPKDDPCYRTGLALQDKLSGADPCTIQILNVWEYLPLMFLFDGQGPLGLRHKVEFILPGSVDCSLVLSSRPLRLVCGLAQVFEETKLGDGRSVLEPQREALNKLPSDCFQVIQTSDESDWLAQLKTPADVIYAFCHGSSENGEARLWMTKDYGQFISHNDIDSNQSINWSRNPLVILAACQWGSIDPLLGTGLANLIFNKGARGYIGVDGNVPTGFASLFMRDFFEEFFAKGNQPLGQVLFNLRQKFLELYNNPGGILFSQFGYNDIIVLS